VTILKRKVILYHKSIESDNLIAFLSLSESITFEKKKDHFFEITTDLFEDEFDLSNLRGMALQEIYQDFTAFICPNSGVFDMKLTYEVLPLVSFGVYTPESLIKAICFLNQGEYITRLKSFYNNHFGHETIDSILGFIKNDMNATKASKELYMHRNTMNYRLDHFVEKSEVNVRHFTGAFAFYLLFS